MQGRNHRIFLGEAEPMGGHNLPSLVEIGLTYLKIWVRQLICLPYHWLRPWDVVPEISIWLLTHAIHTCFRFEQKLNKNKKEVIKHLETTHGQLATRINHLERKTRDQISGKLRFLLYILDFLHKNLVEPLKSRLCSTQNIKKNWKSKTHAFQKGANYFKHLT